MEAHSFIMLLISGVVFFMYGMTMASDFLQKLAANRVRQLVNRLADRPLMGISVGILLTILLQSSGAVTSLLVSLGSAGVVSLSQVMSVIIGSAIGSTFTVQIISFNVAQYGLLIFVTSFAVYFLSSKRLIKNLSGVCMGFGILFYGLELMGHASQQFSQFPSVMEALTYIRSSPLAAVLLTAAVTGFIHSSAMVIGLAMTLSTHGLMDLHDSMYWIYGANIGTTATALLAAIGSNHIGRQVAWAHFFYKVGSVILFLFFTDAFVHWLEVWTPDVVRNIANAHTVFNIIAAILYLPLIRVGSTQIEKMFPPSAGEREFGTKFITKNVAMASTMAYAQAMREALRMGDIVSSMVKDSLKLLETENPDKIEDIHDRDNKVDLLFHEIKSFLVKYSDDSGHFSHETVRLLTFITDLESAADIVDKNIVDLSDKKNALKLEFSRQGWTELKELHQLACEVMDLSMACVQLQDHSLAVQVIAKKRDLRKKERALRERHLERLNQGLRESINTSSIHLEFLSALGRIAGLFSSHAYAVVGDDKAAVSGG